MENQTPQTKKGAKVIAKRIVIAAGGLLLIFSSIAGGLYLPTSAETIGFGMGNLAIIGLGGWLVYQSFKW